MAQRSRFQPQGPSQASTSSASFTRNANVPPPRLEGGEGFALQAHQDLAHGVFGVPKDAASAPIRRSTAPNCKRIGSDI